MHVSEQTAVMQKQPPYLTVPAKVLSYLFHPLFIPTYVFIWLAQRFSFEFAGIDHTSLLFRYVNIFWMTAFFPAFSVFLLYQLKFIESIYLRSQKERIVPYVITMFFYWWMFYLSRNFTDQPAVLKHFYLGIFLSTIFGLIINNFIKISLHAMAISAAFAMVIITCMSYGVHFGLDISIACLLTGLICTARLLVQSHTKAEIYSGIIVGILTQYIAWMVV